MSFPLIPDNLLEVALALPIHGLNNACRTNRMFNTAICNNEHFWRLRVGRDYGNDSLPSNLTTWKRYYELLSNTWTMVENKGITEIELPDSTPVRQVDVYMHTIVVVDIYGRVWGRGLNGPQIINEDGYGRYFHNPTIVSGTEGIDAVQVSCGFGFLYILDVEGNLYSRGWGDNELLSRASDGEVINGTGLVVGPDRPIKQVSCSNDYVIAVDIVGDLWGAGLVPIPGWHRPPTMQRLDLGIKVEQISCGDQHAMFIQVGGDLWGIGVSDIGQLGVISDFVSIGPIRVLPGRKVKSVSCGRSQSAVIDINNDVWTFGLNIRGETGSNETQINVGTNTFNVFSNGRVVSCGYDYTIIIDINGRVWGSGDLHDIQRGGEYTYKRFTDLRVTATDVVTGKSAVYRNLNLI